MCVIRPPNAAASRTRDPTNEHQVRDTRALRGPVPHARTNQSAGVTRRSRKRVDAAQTRNINRRREDLTNVTSGRSLVRQLCNQPGADPAYSSAKVAAAGAGSR
ncbi:unnamed protein product, partial [Iphiclides podalirius]